MMEDYLTPEGENLQKPTPPRHTIGGAVGTFATFGIVDVLAHLGPTGLVIAGLASYVMWQHGPDVYEMLRAEVPLLPALKTPRSSREVSAGPTPTKKWTLWDRALGRHLRADTSVPQTVEEEEQGRRDEADSPIFTDKTNEGEADGLSRITIEQAVAHTVRNSYEVYLGRSLTDDIGRAVKISFRERHLKFIGASQRGKSSEVAALISQVAQTHDPTVVQFAILDLENLTGRLFVELPHVKRVRINGQEVRLHATSPEQVTLYLTYLVRLMEYRYHLSPEVRERQPILIVYLEEFLRLRRMFKAKIAAASSPEERERARATYATLIESIDALCARGLKACIRLWLCAQVDYADEDLREALVNVTDGLSFGVRPRAAQAAGFYEYELLTKNAASKRVGCAVVETAEVRDLVLAIEFDLAARLRAFPDRFPEPGAWKHGNTLETPVETVLEANVGYTGNVSADTLGNADLSTHEEDSIGNDIRETVKRLRQRGLPLREIAPLVGMAGRKYEQFKRLCEEEGLS